jgi:hypothetical protein
MLMPESESPPGESTEEDVLASSRLCSEAERDFRVSEAELFARPFDRDTIAAQTAAVFAKLHAYIAAFRAYHHTDARYMQQSFLGPASEEAAEVIENLHRTINRAAAAHEDFRREKIIYRLLVIERARRSKACP